MRSIKNAVGLIVAALSIGVFSVKPIHAQQPSTNPPANKDNAKSGSAPSDKNKTNPPDTKENDKAPSAAAQAGSVLSLPGLELTTPKDWVRAEVTMTGPLAPQAVFKLPHAEGDAEDGSVRVTHFPSMKGKDDVNLDRWMGQVTKPDGKPFAKEEVKITKSEFGNVRLTMIDLSGHVRMTGWKEAKPNHRMIAAIVDHPQGPHYVVAGGGAKTMEKWSSSIDAFLKSAKVK